MQGYECEDDRRLRKVNALARFTIKTQQVARYDTPVVFISPRHDVIPPQRCENNRPLPIDAMHRYPRERPVKKTNVQRRCGDISQKFPSTAIRYTYSRPARNIRPPHNTKDISDTPLPRTPYRPADMLYANELNDAARTTFATYPRSRNLTHEII